MQAYLSKLPQVGSLLDSAEWAGLMQRYTRTQVKAALEGELDRARRAILAGDTAVPTAAELRRRVELRLAQRTQAGPGRVNNATGVVIQNNMGRSPLAPEAVEAAAAAAGYCNLEMDMDSGERGSRHAHVEELLCRLTGAEAALAVNNNAAAVLLALAAVARGKEGIISRGQVVEIGGSFRVTEVMEQSGVRLVEVGTTNKTYLDDYRRAITAETGVLMRVHPSNYRVVGFQHEVTLAELVALGREYNLPVLDDLGSGTWWTCAHTALTSPRCRKAWKPGPTWSASAATRCWGGPSAALWWGPKSG